jgi:aspartyl-tRNA(Asn)/glutamyl-tRNA(Gln) amidotransferase subunit A
MKLKPTDPAGGVNEPGLFRPGAGEPALSPFLSITQVAQGLRSGEFSSEALTQLALDRIRQFDTSLHAFVTVTAEVALAQARHADQERSRGLDRGALHGVPIALKDNIFTQGIRTTCHSRVMRDHIPDENAYVVERLRESGAVVLGKTGLWEFAYGVPAPDDEIPAPRNPWSLEHSPGGSSSGSGAAVAAGLVFGAVGTDTGGSIRHPSAVCGLVGMKPSFGLVSQRGVVALSPSLDHIGPMTRTVHDNALMLQAMAGFDARDPNSRASAAGLSPTAFIGQPLRGLSAGVPANLLEAADLDTQVSAAFEEALRALRDLGLTIEHFQLEGFDAVHADSTIILEFEAWREHEARLQLYSSLYGEALKKRLTRAPRHSAESYRQARLRAASQSESLRALLSSRFSVLLMPGREAPAMSMADLYSETPTRRGRITRLGNLTGAPALVLPMGFSEQPRLPLSLQIIGAHFAEARVYQVAAAYEASQRWVDSHPVWLDRKGSTLANSASGASSAM